jgi:diketogulonate reductase-like aldo/keto reductase
MILTLLKFGSMVSLKNNSTCEGEAVRVALSAGIEFIKTACAWAGETPYTKKTRIRAG